MFRNEFNLRNATANRSLAINITAFNDNCPKAKLKVYVIAVKQFIGPIIWLINWLNYDLQVI